jgi:hypothetical protein
MFDLCKNKTASAAATAKPIMARAHPSIAAAPGFDQTWIWYRLTQSLTTAQSRLAKKASM